MMTSAQVVITSVNVITKSPSQDYTHPDHHNLLTYVTYDPKFNQEVNAFIKVLTEWSLMITQEQRKRPVGNSQKWLRLLTEVVIYKSF